MVTAQDWDELNKLAQGAAKRVARSWPDAIEIEDLAQGVLMRLVESPGAAARIFEEDEPTRKAFMIRVAHQVASEQFQDYEQFSGNYTYDTAIVRGLLDNGGLTAELPKFSADIADLREGLANLADSGSAYYADIVNRYVHELPETYESNGRTRNSRAVAALTTQMNRIGTERRKNFTEGPGSRFSRSNQSGQVESIVDWQGDLMEGRN